ncbi:MAG: putative HTH transcriptional regulator [Acidimicrobiales bacterium]|jgi:predicted HTH transcriptional regulator
MFYFALVGVIAATLGFVVGKKAGGAGTVKKEPYFSTASSDELQYMRGEAKEALDERTKNRKEKILHMMKGEVETQKKLEECSEEAVAAGVTRVDVEELLDVSDGTARKYLNMLEDEGKIQQVGESGRGVRKCYCTFARGFLIFL